MTSREDKKKSYIDISHRQAKYHGERICGDTYISRRYPENNRILIVLSDGMGHGLKANVMSTITASMAINYIQDKMPVEKIALRIMNALPVDSVRKISYATFTILDIREDGKVDIIEYENPECTILRGEKIYDPGWDTVSLTDERFKGREIRKCSFVSKKEDRIIFYSDGVVLSGLGTKKYPLGWENKNLEQYVKGVINDNHSISSHKLASKIINRAIKNDEYYAKDDISCGVIYFREPRRLLLCTGPPYNKKEDKKLARVFQQFEGRKIISGATTADIIAEHLDRKIINSIEILDADLPPTSSMEGADLITEGILTLEKVHRVLEQMNANTVLGNGPADQIVKLLLKSDEIHFMVGTHVNVAHQDPNLPVGLEIRRTVVHRIARVLENKFFKFTQLNFL
jgi:hypothetical protein